MDYRIKSIVQNTISLLPLKISNRIYFFLQRRFGNLKKVNPYLNLISGKTILEKLSLSPPELSNKTFLEIGTGRSPVLALSLWLQGAKEIVTVDINTYFSSLIWNETIVWIRTNKDLLLRELPNINESRLDKLLYTSTRNENIINTLKGFGIIYLSPCDASNLPYPNNYFDFHISYNVLEHISIESLKSIFVEGKRVTTNNSIFVHYVDHTDHFSHSDSNLSKINFLRFNDLFFHFLSGNRYMYMNRLRDDDYERFFDYLSFDMIEKDIDLDNNILEILNSSESSELINSRFSKKSNFVLSILHSWYIFKK